MGKHTSLGLDELMIVNPGPPGGAAIYLGADGVFYRAPGVGRPDQPLELGLRSGNAEQRLGAAAP